MAILGRAQPFRPHLPTIPLLPAAPVPRPHALVVTQSLQRPYVGRTTRTPLRLPVFNVMFYPTAPVPRGQPVVVDQALQRPQTGRRGSRPLVLPPRIFPPPGTSPAIVTAPVTFTWASNQRARIHRKLPQISRAGPYTGPPALKPGTFILQGIKRAQIGRGAPKPHAAPPIVLQIVAGIATPSSRFIYQAIQRMFVGRRVTQPQRASAPAPQGTTTSAPQPPTLLISQAVWRSQQGRKVTQIPQHGGPVLTPGVPFRAPPSLVVLQAKQRPQIGRSTPHPHVAPVAQASTPFIQRAIQAVKGFRRPFEQRKVPLVIHAAPVILPPPGPPPLVVFKPSRTRANLRLVPFRPHLALPVTLPNPFRPTVFVPQGLKRSVLRPPPPRPHVVPPLVPLPQFIPRHLLVQIFPVAKGRWLVTTTADSRWKIGQPSSRWTISPVVSGRWTIGVPMTTSISTASLEYVRVPVAATISGAAYNPTVDSVKMAFLNTTRDPLVTDWVMGSWETAGQTYFALCLVGPGGATQLTAGTYYVWVQVTDSPEVPAKQAGVITVT